MQKASRVSEDSPSISIVIPTYNSERTLAQCLESIAMQDYPKEKIEIIMVDGGSKDKTLEIARKYRVDKILHNTQRVEESGRALGIEASKNEIIAFVDQDNILVSSDWLKKMVEPFKEDEIVGSEPLFYSYRKGDSAIVRYCSLIGADDPLYIYIGYYDRFCHFRGKWTEAPIEERDEGDYLHVKLIDSMEIPTMGANGFMMKKVLLKKLRYRPFIHTDIIYQLVKSGHQDFVKVKVGLVHLHARSVTGFLKKKLRRVHRHNMTNRAYNDVDLKKVKLQRLILYTLIFLTVVDLVKGYKRKPDIAWLLHPLMCFLTLLTYAVGVVMMMITRVEYRES